MLQWGRGFYGRRMMAGCSGAEWPRGTPPYCNFPPNRPWVDLLPSGAQNFWALPRKCKASFLGRAGHLGCLAGCCVVKLASELV